MANVTAFVLDDTIAADDGGATIASLPGVWSTDRPTLPSAIGYTVQELQDAIALFGLPLKEVKVPESQAFDEFVEPPGRMESAPETIGPGVDETELTVEADMGTADVEKADADA